MCKLLPGALVSVMLLWSCAGRGGLRESTDPSTIRFATFNASLYRDAPGRLVSDLERGDDPQARAVAEIIQRVRPDVLLLNEFDHDAAGRAAQLFHDRYLAVGQNVSGSARAAEPIHYPDMFTAPVNTGVPSGLDLDGNGVVGKQGRAYGGDALGYGLFPGQYGMVLFSRLPVAREEVRTFRELLWKDMPGALLPVDPRTGAPFYDEQELAVLRLSSKSHWDVPLVTDGRRIHVLASHPTPGVFDGPEDRNGRRNHDEIRFWRDYVDPGRSAWIQDDAGRRGGLGRGASFVIMGDLNADPVDGEAGGRAVSDLLRSGLVNTRLTPTSPGGPEQARLQGGANRSQRGPPENDTSDFNDASAGNLRADYVLPSSDLELLAAGVFWPLARDPLFRLVGVHPFPSSDHRLVWVLVRRR